MAKLELDSACGLPLWLTPIVIYMASKLRIDLIGLAYFSEKNYRQRLALTLLIASHFKLRAQFKSSQAQVKAELSFSRFPEQGTKQQFEFEDERIHGVKIEACKLVQTLPASILNLGEWIVSFETYLVTGRIPVPPPLMHPINEVVDLRREAEEFELLLNRNNFDEITTLLHRLIFRRNREKRLNVLALNPLLSFTHKTSASAVAKSLKNANVALSTLAASPFERSDADVHRIALGLWLLKMSGISDKENERVLREIYAATGIKDKFGRSIVPNETSAEFKNIRYDAKLKLNELLLIQ